jgi:hypothetical protein
MANVPNDPNVGLLNAWILGQAQVEGSITNAINAFFDPTGGLPVAPVQYDRYISQATANGWIINNVYYWNGIAWAGELPATGQQIYVSGGATFPTRFVYYTGATWAVVPNGNVSGPGASTDTAIVRWSGVTGDAVENSLATVSNTGSIDIPFGESLNIGGTPAVSGYAGNNIALATTLPNITTGTDNIAAGLSTFNALSTGNQNVGLGFNVGTLLDAGNFNVGIGAQALPAITSGEYNIGIGFNTGQNTTTGSNTLSVGYQADARNSTNGIAFGTNSITDAVSALSVGDGAECYGVSSLALGAGSVTYGTTNLVIGNNSTVDATAAASVRVSVMGTLNTVSGLSNDSIILGGGSVCDTSTNTFLVGRQNTATNLDDAVIIGRSNNIASNSQCMSIGTNTLTTNAAMAIGYGSTASGLGAIVLGNSSGAQNAGALALGSATVVSGVDAVGIGLGNNVTGVSGVGIGHINTVSGITSIAIGESNNISGDQSFGLGVGLTVSGNTSGAFGKTVTVTTDNTFTFGSSASTIVNTPGFIQAARKEGASSGNLSVGVAYGPAVDVRLIIVAPPQPGFYDIVASGTNMINVGTRSIDLKQNRMYLITANIVGDINNPAIPTNNTEIDLNFTDGGGDIILASYFQAVQTGTERLNCTLVGVIKTTLLGVQTCYVRLRTGPTATVTTDFYRLTATLLA